MKKKFIGFVTAGDGGIDYCVACCMALIAGGVDMLEIGLPFSDPVADGAVIQQSSQRALQAGVTPHTVLEIARCIRQHSAVPLILFSYYNPLLQQGEKYLQQARLAGFDGVLVVDYAPSQYCEDRSFYNTIKSCGLFPVLLVAPSTTEERLPLIVKQADGFIYYACQKGTTGVKKSLPQDVASKINLIKSMSDLPVVAGFGIADRVSAAQALSCADGFVVGSAFVKLMADRVDPLALKKLAQQIDPR